MSSHKDMYKYPRYASRLSAIGLGSSKFISSLSRMRRVVLYIDICQNISRQNIRFTTGI